MTVKSGPLDDDAHGVWPPGADGLLTAASALT